MENTCLGDCWEDPTYRLPSCSINRLQLGAERGKVFVSGCCAWSILGGCVPWEMSLDGVWDASYCYPQAPGILNG